MQKKISQKPGWSRRRSELSGYEISLYRTDPSGEYIRADFSIKDSRIRLMVEDRSENVYAAVIEKGKIISEMMGGGPSAEAVRNKMLKKSPFFCTMPDRSALKLVHGHYGIRQKVPVSKKKKRRSRSVIFAAAGAAGALILFLLFRAFSFN